MTSSPDSQPIGPQMADEWRPLVMDALRHHFAMTFESLIDKTLLQSEVYFEQPDGPRGPLSTALLAMEAEGEIAIENGREGTFMIRRA